MTTLKEVHEITEKLHKGKTAIHLNVAIDTAIILANRVEELEAQRDELLKTADEMLKLIENSDFEDDDMAPDNDDMNRWHRSVAYADLKFEVGDKEEPI